MNPSGLEADSEKNVAFAKLIVICFFLYTLGIDPAGADEDELDCCGGKMPQLLVAEAAKLQRSCVRRATLC